MLAVDTLVQVVTASSVVLAVLVVTISMIRVTVVCYTSDAGRS